MLSVPPIAFAVLTMIALAASAAQAAEKRVALVIGNASYRSAAVLENTLNDADSLTVTSASSVVASKAVWSTYPDVRILAGGFDTARNAETPIQAASTEQIVPPSKPSEVQALDRRL